jgi:heme/copper-type cytochrome/quinol oxidase subunit 3
MSTHEQVVIEPEDPALLNANLAAGARLMVSAVVFLFMSFVFAFFYLRALNSNHSFLMPHVKPPDGWGVAVLVCVLGATAVFEVARRQLRDGTGGAWRLGAGIATALSLAAVALQAIEYFNLSFGAADGGLASVFFGFTAVFALFWLGAAYWIETLWAQSLRQPTHADGDVEAPSQVLRPSADGCVLFLAVMSLVEILAFILLYLVK